MNFSLIITVKDRKEHFLKTFSSLITQEQQYKYEIVFVDYASQDGFGELLQKQIELYQDLFSDSLTCIKRVHLKKDFKFNSAIAKNIGAHFSNNDVLSFSDVDVFIGMSYHRYWLDTLKLSDNSFVSSRIQETKEYSSKRLSPKINYGNIIVHRKHFFDIGGFNEENITWGGDDDDVIHRLKLNKLREINPISKYHAHQTSILHDDSLRIDPTYKTNVEYTKKKMKIIYDNKIAKNNNFLLFYQNNKSIIEMKKIYNAK